MSRRFPLVLTDEMFAEFYRYFPWQGARTAVLRKVVYKLIQKAKVKTPSVEMDEIVEKVMDEVEGRWD